MSELKNMPEFNLHANDVCVRYPNGYWKWRTEKTVLANVHLRIRPGSVTSIVGPSGCGKSTLLRMFLGTQAPTNGNVLVNGQPKTRVSRECGVVFQNYSLLRHLTVRQNIEAGYILANSSIPGRLFGLVTLGFMHRAMARGSFTKAAREKLLSASHYLRLKEEATAKASQLIEEVGLDLADGDKYPFELSGGMRQRVALAQAVMLNPPILLMDEPFGALDLKTRQDMQDFAIQLQRKYGMTLVFVTHDIAEGCRVGDRLVALSQYWSENTGKKGVGATVVIDTKLPAEWQSYGDFWQTPEFCKFEELVTLQALNVKHLQPRREFLLDHPDAVAV